MIFVGDIAIHGSDSLKFVNVPKLLLKNDWIINLEGALVNKKYSKGVYNNMSGFKSYLEQLPINIACLANNHITDTESILKTQKELNKLNIKFTGAGTIENYNKEVVHGDFVYINFAWEVIQANPVSQEKEGVNLLTKKNVYSQFDDLLIKYPNKKIIIVFHWNYELELYPMPNQRELAKSLIDKGAHLIIGHHSHLVQGIETYKGKFIVHGLGNWAFEQNKYYDGKLSFPDSSLRQCAFEYDEKTGHALVHLFEYNVLENSVYFKKSISLLNNSSFEATYQGQNTKEYLKFFKKNRIKRKLLPIYKSTDSNFRIKIKNMYMKFRDIGISILK